jgi:putative redox protein
MSAMHTRVTLDASESGLAVTAHFDRGARLGLSSPSGPAGPSPVQAVLACLGGCAAMDVISMLRKQRQQVTAYEVRVEAERRPDHPRYFTRIEIVHRIQGHHIRPEAVAEAIRLSDTKYCSVHAMLEPRAEIVSRFEILPP